MNIEEFRDFCLSQKGVSEELPFGPDTLVYKVMGKIFALTSLDSEVFSVNLKCNPDRAIQLREQFEYIVPGYHMNKKHWNTVNATVASTGQLKELILHSFTLVVASLPKKIQLEYQNL
jgi:predicted DNA-binding protein (MmcQ/YjbR family)